MARTVSVCVCEGAHENLYKGKGPKGETRGGGWYCFLYVEISRIFIASHCGNSFKSLLASALLFLLLF